jgi:hypothetical protein
MLTLLVYAFVLLPPLLAFGLLVVKEPPSAGWSMWLVSAVFAAGFGVWAMSQPDTGFGSRIYYYLLVGWTAWPPVVALGIRLFLGR